MKNEDKLIQENIKLYNLYQSLEKMTYLPSIKLQQMMNTGKIPTEAESSIYYTLKLTTEILKSYMKDKDIPAHEDNSFKRSNKHPNSELLAHSDFSCGLAELIKLYQVLDDEQLGEMEPDMIGSPSEHPLNEYRNYTGYNHAVYFDAYFALLQKSNAISKKEFFRQHPILDPNEYFTLI